jgi:hypothetical protein
MKSRTYKLLSGKHGRFEAGVPRAYAKNDLIELTPEEAENLGERVKLIGEPAAAAPAEATEVPPETVEPAAPATLGLAELHWSKAAASIGKLGTAAEVEAAIAEEKAGKGRRGVLDAAEARLREIASR